MLIGCQLILGNNKNEQDKRKVEEASRKGQSRANKKGNKVKGTKRARVGAS